MGLDWISVGLGGSRCGAAVVHCTFPMTFGIVLRRGCSVDSYWELVQWWVGLLLLDRYLLS